MSEKENQAKVERVFDTPLSIQQGSRQYELFMMATTIIALISMIFYYLIPISQSIREILFAIDTIVAVVFLIDFFISLYRAPQKFRYLITWGWIDFLGSFPRLPLLRMLRIARMWRSVAAMRGVSLRDLINDLKENRAESTLLGTFLGLILVLAFGSMFVLAAESGDPNANILSSQDAVWWALVTVATVGYGDYFPVTEQGRIVAVVMMILGVTIFTVFTSFLATGFLSKQGQKQQAELDRLHQKLDELYLLLSEQNRKESAEQSVADREGSPH